MAAIASGITIGWGSTIASIPTGWTRNAALDGRHPKGAAAGIDPGVTGGGATHTHTSPAHTHTIPSHTHVGGTSGDSPETILVNNVSNVILASTHTHGLGTSSAQTGTTDGTAATTTATANDPDNIELIYIQSDGSPTGIPINGYVFSDDNPLPTGYTIVAATANRFPKGAAVGVGGGTTGGSSASHTHTGVTHVHGQSVHTHTGTSGAPTGTILSTNVNTNVEADVSHTHAADFLAGASSAVTAASGATGGTAYEPAWFKLSIAQNTLGSVNSTLGPIALWLLTLATIPAGWRLCDGGNGTPDLRNRFIKGAATVAEGASATTGGSAGHDHTDPSTHTHDTAHTHSTTLQSAASVSQQRGGTLPGNATFFGHTHTAGTSGVSTGTSGTSTQTVDASTDTQPPFITVAFIQLQITLDVTIDSPTADQVMGNPSFLVDWSLSAGTQADYRLKVYANDQTTVVYDSGQIANATTSATIPIGYLNNLQTYYIEVTVHDTSVPALTGTSTKRRITTSWTPPATLTGLTLTPVGGT